MFDYKWIEISAKDYVRDISEAQDLSTCLLMIVASQMPFHIIGLPLFQDYYTVHDMDTGRMGFAPHKESRKAKV